MGLFSTKKKELPPLMTAADFDEVAHYESALGYLVGLSDEEYKKVCDVAAIHRKAFQESAAVLGQPNEATTYINPPEPATEPADEPNFLDEIASEKPKAGRKINVKD